MIRLTLALLAATLLAPQLARAQAADACSAPLHNEFAAATIKPPDPDAKIRPAGFYGYPGGRIFFGGDLKMLVQYAFGLQEYQVVGGPDWSGGEQFDINAVPSDAATSRTLKLKTAEPSSEQREMLQSLLKERFGLRCHIEAKTGEVYVLTRGSKELQFTAAKDPASDPRAIVFLRQGGIVDGEAEGTNTTTDYLALRLSRYLQLPVLNQTGIAGSYDFHVEAVDPENHDLPSAVYSVVDRLGLKIKRGRGPTQTLVIDHADHPGAN